MEQKAVIGDPQAGLPGPSLLDAVHYTDPAQYKLEIERILHRSWLVVCPSSDLASPRRHVVWDRFGQSVVVVRLDDGTLAAWHNVCQHRGARLVEGAGQCESGTFRCPWHGFAYDLEGKVSSVPLRESFDERELKGLRTPQVAVAEWAGLVWICLEGGEDLALDGYLGDIKPELDGYGFDRYRTVARTQWTIGCNWKTVIDGFNETWHVPFTHKDSLGGMVQWRSASLKILGRHSMMTIPYRRRSQPAENGDHRKTMICHYLAFPNTIFSCFPTHHQMFTAWPAGPRETVFTASHVMGPTPEGMSDDEWTARGERDWQHFLTVAEEDLEVLQAAGGVYESLGFRRNMFNTEEARLTAFHATVNELAGISPNGPKASEGRR